MERIKMFDCIKTISENSKRYAAFTLAEVLIVLGIIGVIAAMTIPTLVHKYQKQIYVTRLKKFYSSFSNNVKTYMATTGCSDLACTGMFKDIYTASDILKSNFKYRDYSSIGDNRNVTTKFLNGDSSGGSYLQSFTIFVSPDGAWIGFNPFTPSNDTEYDNCTMFSDAPDGAKLKNACTRIEVDVNGKDAPNVYGVDTFDFFLGNNGVLYPAGGSDFNAVGGGGNYSNECVSGQGSGMGCAGRVIQDGWQMEYNYCGYGGWYNSKCVDDKPSPPVFE